VGSHKSEVQGPISCLKAFIEICASLVKTITRVPGINVAVCCRLLSNKRA